MFSCFVAIRPWHQWQLGLIQLICLSKLNPHIHVLKLCYIHSSIVLIIFFLQLANGNSVHLDSTHTYLCVGTNSTHTYLCVGTDSTHPSCDFQDPDQLQLLYIIGLTYISDGLYGLLMYSCYWTVMLNVIGAPNQL
jgi:hypothetical protein